MFGFGNSKKKAEHAIRQSLIDEPVVQEYWFVYKCRMCSTQYDALWHVGDKDGVREGYVALSRRTNPAAKYLRWFQATDIGTVEYPYRPPETVVHGCSDKSAGVADLIGVQCASIAAAQKAAEGASDE